MLRTAPSIPRAASRETAVPWRSWLRHVWDWFMRDDHERFLSEARDLADLECRLRRLERGRAERFSPLPPQP